MNTIMSIAGLLACCLVCCAASTGVSGVVTSITPGVASDVQQRAAMTMMLAWQTGRADGGAGLPPGSLMSAAMRHAGGLTEGEALVTAADHATAVRRMEQAIGEWSRLRGADAG